jgi:hypothetical protein
MEQESVSFSQTVERLERRVATLETSNRRLRRWSAALVVAVVGVFLMGQAANNKRVEAEAFILVDSAGKERGGLVLEEGNPLLFVGNRDGSAPWTMILSHKVMHLPAGMKSINSKVKNPQNVNVVEKSGVDAKKQKKIELQLAISNLENDLKQAAHLDARNVCPEEMKSAEANFHEIIENFFTEKIDRASEQAKALKPKTELVLLLAQTSFIERNLNSFEGDFKKLQLSASRPDAARFAQALVQAKKFLAQATHDPEELKSMSQEKRQEVIQKMFLAENQMKEVEGLLLALKK